MKAPQHSFLALSIIAVVAIGLGEACAAAAEPSDDFSTADTQVSPAPYAQYVHAAPLVSAVASRRDALVDEDPSLTAAYFAEPVADVETTADNGVRQRWAGDVGDGAIYAHSRRTYGEAHLVYGEIYALWQQNGGLHWLGYPLDDEHDAGWGCALGGALREQTFTAGLEAPGYHRALCWAPGKVWTYEWVDPGSELTRLPPVQRGR